MFVRLASLAGLLAVAASALGAGIDDLRLPPGFEIEIVTNKVPNARQIATAGDVIFVGTRRAGKVYAVDTSTTPAQVTVIADDLNMPSGVAIHDDDLYVGAVNTILRFPDILSRFGTNMEPEIVTDRLPKKRHHGWKYLSFGPDDMLYVPVGVPCNICQEKDSRFGTILRMDPGNGEAEIYAKGIRNSVGLAWHPVTAKLWFTDNGRDMFGDDLPSEEVNRVDVPGTHFGFPFVHANGILDPEFGLGRDPAQFQPPIVEIQAHSAALGIDFYPGGDFPAEYHGALFIAEHGSWNRSKKVGYQVSVVKFTNGAPRYEPFITGWLRGEKSWGRPNDLVVAEDGTLLISEDDPGTIYRVRFAGERERPLGDAIEAR